MKKFFKRIKNLWYGLIWGLKTTEDSMLKGDTDTIPGTAIIQEVNDKRVSKALLKGEVTQEVEELRYRTYKVDREAKQYEYIAPTLAFKHKENDSKFVTYENSNNYEVITIQPNEVLQEDILESLQHIDSRGKRPEYLVKIERNFWPRFKIDQYLKRVVVLKIDDTHAMLDLYVSKYPNDKDFKSKGFITELEKIKNNSQKSDITDIDKLWFITSHAYQVNDMLKFEFDNLVFKGITEFDGHYILHFKSRIIFGGLDLTDNFYSKTMDEKYKNKVKKDVPLDLFGNPQIETYVCEHCGKQITYNTEAIDEQEVTKPRDIDDETTIEDNSVIEFRDARISLQTFGKVLCKDCLAEYIKDSNNLLKTIS